MLKISKSVASSKALVAAAFVLGMMSTAYAYSDEQQQMCTGDAFRLCSSEIPDVDRVTACMVQHKSELSAGCKAVFAAPSHQANATPAPVASTRQVKAPKPMNITPQKVTKRAGA